MDTAVIHCTCRECGHREPLPDNFVESCVRGRLGEVFSRKEGDCRNAGWGNQCPVCSGIMRPEQPTFFCCMICDYLEPVGDDPLRGFGHFRKCPQCGNDFIAFADLFGLLDAHQWWGKENGLDLFYLEARLLLIGGILRDLCLDPAKPLEMLKRLAWKDSIYPERHFEKILEGAMEFFEGLGSGKTGTTSEEWQRLLQHFWGDKLDE